MKMDGYTILGIIIIAIGTALMVFGSGKSDSKSQKEITDKIVETQHKIEELKTGKTVDSAAITKIESEFNNWADN
jgi:hypothetical protein